jgi:Ni/Co efflux regulator RcnB
MDMKIKTTLSILGAALALTMSAAANADGGRGRDRDWEHRGHHHRHWDRHDHRHHGRYYVPHRVVRERIVIERPVYVAPPAPVYYGHYPRVPRYPGIVVNVDIPPLVIPLR